MEPSKDSAQEALNMSKRDLVRASDPTISNTASLRPGAPCHSHSVDEGGIAMDPKKPLNNGVPIAFMYRHDTMCFLINESFLGVEAASRLLRYSQKDDMSVELSKEDAEHIFTELANVGYELKRCRDELEEFKKLGRYMLEAPSLQ